MGGFGRIPQVNYNICILYQVLKIFKFVLIYQLHKTRLCKNSPFFDRVSI